MRPPRTRLACAALLLCAAFPTPSFAQRCPKVMLAVQRSGSMLSDINNQPNPPSRWNLVTSYLPAALNGARGGLYGLETFASMGDCWKDTSIDLQPLPDQIPAVLARLNAAAPNGINNNAEALRRAVQDGHLDDAARDNVIVLFTNGAPNCNRLEPKASLDEITAAAARMPPIRTVIIGYLPPNDATLNQWALAGKAPRNGGACGGANLPDCYYHGDDPADVKAALLSIQPPAPCGCDESCFVVGCPAGQRCSITSPGSSPRCVPDRCAIVDCAAGSYCRNGDCIVACPACAPNQKCVNGECVTDRCAGAQCAAGTICSDGSCVKDQCALLGTCCPPPSLCDPLSGTCADDPCHGVTCPQGSICNNGWCGRGVLPDLAQSADLAQPADLLVATPLPLPISETGCGCTLGAKGHITPGLASVILLLLGVALRRQRRPIQPK